MDAHCPDLLADLLAAPDTAVFWQQQTSHLRQNPACAAQLAHALKSEADHYLRTDLARARHIVRLMFELAEQSGHSPLRALALRAEGNVLMIGDYRCQEAIACYDEAAAIYNAAGQPAAAGQSQVGKVGCLYFLGRYEEAIGVGDAARPVLAAHEEWGALSGLLLNLAAIHRRLGQGKSALALLEEAAAICARTGSDGQLPGILLNQANVLCDLGQLPAALAAGRRAESLFQTRQQRVGAARAQVSQAIAHFHLGRYTEALDLFDRARATYEADGRFTDALLVDRFAADLLLQIGRYAEVVDRCQQVRDRYRDQAIPYEVAQALRTEAAAYAALGHSQKGLDSLAEARALLADNPVRAALVDLETAVLLTHHNQAESALTLALTCGQTLRDHELPLPAARADLAAAQAAWQLGRSAQAHSLYDHLLHDDSELSPWLRFQAYRLAGQIAWGEGQVEQAIAAYQQAIEQLDLLIGHLMVELRADFLQDKAQIYEEMVLAQLATGQPAAALPYVSQAKSRALMDMLSHRLTLRLTPRQPQDEPLIEQLTGLRQRRNQLLRRAAADQDEADQAEDRALLLKLETEITAVWERLLIRHADYARDLDLLRGQSLPGPPAPDADTLLLEFFVAQGDLLIFLVSQDGVEAVRLADGLARLNRPSRLLHINLKAVAHARPDHIDDLLASAQTQLAALYQILLQPIAPRLARYERLLLVPHGALLHYLPFAALYDGQHYLAERYQTVNLPNAALRQFPPTASGPVGRPSVFGCSSNGRLPYALAEATAVADLLGGAAYLEEAATLDQLQSSAAHSPILHLATHGDFNPDNPFFSSLQLADGQLTTLDVFNLRLPGSLVVLSACQTGRSVVGGGDELLGLMRAFLYAGAAALLLSRWPIHDDATGHFMTHFYRQLQNGRSQSEALRQTQHHFLSGQAGDAYRHPYYWAAFFLVTLQ
jgi:CHAT domain-containing protein